MMTEQTSILWIWCVCLYVWTIEYTFSDLQVPKEAGADLLCFPKPGWDEWRGRSAIQLAAHAEEAHPERRLRGEQQHSWMDVD